MRAIGDNLFTLLTLIVAPAVLTNATSVLALNTANRFGRLVDRSRQLVEETKLAVRDADLDAIRLRQVGRLRRRADLLLRAQTSFYAALGLFVATALVSVIGAALAGGHPLGYQLAGLGGVLVGTTAALALFYGCSLVIAETRLAVVSLGEETELLKARMESALAAPPPR